jgi:coiled-coil domain-containing protein 12
LNIAPKRPNWDLKRDMEKKLAKLDRKTQQAINTLIRKSSSYHDQERVQTWFLGRRLAAQQGTPDDLSARIKAQEQQDADDTDSDEE